MLAPSPVVKTTAKTALSGNWLQSIVVCTVLIFVFFIGLLTASAISIFSGFAGYIIFFALFLIFALSPLLVGVIFWFRRLLWGQTDSALLIFKYFATLDEYKRVLHFVLLLATKIVSAAIIFFFPSIIVWVLSGEWFYNLFDLSFPVWTSSLWTLNSFLAIFAILALVFFMLRYYLSIFLFVSNDNIHPDEVVNMSTIISKRTGADFWGLVLSFSGWIILSLFVAPLIFTLPYFISAYCVHCRFAVTAYNRDVDKFNSTEAPKFSTDEI